jgi:hypothetical protein
VQLDVSMDDPPRVKVAEPLGHVEGECQISLPVEFPLGGSPLLQTALVDKGLEIHLAGFGEHEDSDFLVVGEGPAVPDGPLLGPAGSVFVGWGSAGLLAGSGSEDEAVRAERVVLDDHLEFRLGGLFLEEVVPFGGGEGNEFDPTPMVSEDLGVGELGVYLDFREGAVEVLLGLFDVVSGLERNYLDSIDPAIEPVSGPVHLSKTPSADNPQVLVVGREVLS